MNPYGLVKISTFISFSVYCQYVSTRPSCSFFISDSQNFHKYLLPFFLRHTAIHGLVWSYIAFIKRSLKDISFEINVQLQKKKELLRLS